MTEESVTGIIICDGGDNNTNEILSYKDKTFMEHIIETLSQVCERILISANCENYNLLPFPVFIDVYQNQGTLGAVHGGLKLSTSDKNLIVSCNMPLIDVELLNNLTKAADEVDAVATFDEKKVYPLPILLKKSALRKVKDMILEGESKVENLFNEVKCNRIRWEAAEKRPELRMSIKNKDDLQNLLDSEKK